MKKLIGFILMIAVFVLCRQPETMLGVTEINPNTWAELQTAMSTNGAYIKLTQDITAGADDTYLEVNSSTTVHLDLNGCTINRGLTEAVYNGYVIKVNTGATLYIDDTSTLGEGTITGGNNSDDGGGISVNEGILYFNGGSITGNKSSTNGGGIKLYYGNVFISDGSITLNTASIRGGAIFTTYGTITISGGSITGNSTEMWNGGAIATYSNSDYPASLKITGGQITGNTSNTENQTTTISNGGAVYIDSNTSFYIGGTATISGNLVGSGDSQKINNVYLPENCVINISTETPLTTGASIGVSTEVMSIPDAPVTISSEGSSDYSSYFFSDSSDYLVANSGTGPNQVLRLERIVSNPTTWAALQTAMATDGAYIKLTQNITAGASDTYLEVNANTTVHLDLNGCTINRELAETEAVADGYVIKVNSNATLYIDDTSTSGEGTITGGNNTGYGGGIYINCGTLNLDGGKVTQNTANYGGGISIDYGTLNLDGGRITQNTASSGGGIYQYYGNMVIQQVFR